MCTCTTALHEYNNMCTCTTALHDDQCTTTKSLMQLNILFLVMHVYQLLRI
jgi:hypothetical protein